MIPLLSEFPRCARVGTQPGLWTAVRLVADGQLKVAEKTLTGHIEWGVRRRVLGIVHFGGADVSIGRTFSTSFDLAI